MLLFYGWQAGRRSSALMETATSSLRLDVACPARLWRDYSLVGTAGHSPVQTDKAGSWPTQSHETRCWPQTVQRSMSQSDLCGWPTATPQSGQGLISVVVIISPQLGCPYDRGRRLVALAVGQIFSNFCDVTASRQMGQCFIETQVSGREVNRGSRYYNNQHLSPYSTRNLP